MRSAVGRGCAFILVAEGAGRAAKIFGRRWREQRRNLVHWIGMDGQGSAAGGGGSACWVICELIGWDGFDEDRWPHLVISATVSGRPIPSSTNVHGLSAGLHTAHPGV
jgi:hypothetical protein